MRCREPAASSMMSIDDDSIYEEINQLRIPALKEILRYAGVRVGGNKSALRERLRELFSMPENHHSLLPKLRSFSSQPSGVCRTPAGSASRTPHYVPPGQSASSSTPMQVPFCQRSSLPNTQPGDEAHEKPLTHGPRPSHMVQWPFFSDPETLLPPTALIHGMPISVRNHAKRFFFRLTERQMMKLSSYGMAESPHGPYRLILRPQQRIDVTGTPCRCGSDCKEKGVFVDKFPACVTWKLNGLQLPDAETARTNPIDITKQWTNSMPHGPHGSVLEVSQTLRNEAVFMKHVVTLVITRVGSPSALCETIRQHRMLPAMQCRELVNARFHEEENSEISATRIIVSLKCPLGLNKMTTPCRGHSCSHVQCFDAITYLKMNERQFNWTCPVCHKPLPFSSMCVDGFISEILSQTPPGTSAVELMPGGGWTEVGSPYSDDVESGSESDDDGNEGAGEMGVSIPRTCAVSAPSGVPVSGIAMMSGCRSTGVPVVASSSAPLQWPRVRRSSDAMLEGFSASFRDIVGPLLSQSYLMGMSCNLLLCDGPACLPTRDTPNSHQSSMKVHSRANT